MDKKSALNRQASENASETVYDAPDSVLTVPDQIPASESSPSNSPDREILSKTVSNVTSADSTNFTEQSGKQESSHTSSEVQPVARGQTNGRCRNIWTVWDGVPYYNNVRIWNDSPRQLCFYQRAFSPYYYRQQRVPASRKTRRRKESEIMTANALKLAVIILGLFTLLVVLVTVFVAVYYGLTSEVLLPISGAPLDI